LVEICTATNPLPASALTASNSCLLFANLTFPSVSPSPARVTTRVGARRALALRPARARVAAVVVFTFKTPLHTNHHRVERSTSRLVSPSRITPRGIAHRRHIVVTRRSSRPLRIDRARSSVCPTSPSSSSSSSVASIDRSIERSRAHRPPPPVLVASSSVARTSSRASSSVVVVVVCRVGSVLGPWRIGFRMSEFLCSVLVVVYV